MIVDPQEIETKEVCTWQGLHLLHYPMSSCSQKVRILMGELGVNFQSHEINLMRGENRTDWFLGINNRGLVPVLVDDGVVHIESNDIIVYLDEKFSGANSFLPTNPDQRSRLNHWLRLEDERHADLRTVTFTYLAPPKDDIPIDSEDRSYITRLHTAFSEMDEVLKDSAYLLADQISLADISWFITLHRLVLAGYPMSNHPHLADYYQRLRRRPAFTRQWQAGPPLLRAAGGVYRTLRALTGRSLKADYKQWSRT
ncbi:MAG: glutathione S-transferase family protein, partial [Pseudomonadota bacterium]